MPSPIEAASDGSESAQSLGASVVNRAVNAGFDAALVTVNSHALAHFLRLELKAPTAFPDGFEPGPRFNGLPLATCDRYSIPRRGQPVCCFIEYFVGFGAAKAQHMIDGAVAVKR